MFLQLPSGVDESSSAPPHFCLVSFARFELILYSSGPRFLRHATDQENWSMYGWDFHGRNTISRTRQTTARACDRTVA